MVLPHTLLKQRESKTCGGRAGEHCAGAEADCPRGRPPGHAAVYLSHIDLIMLPAGGEHSRYGCPPATETGYSSATKPATKRF